MYKIVKTVHAKKTQGILRLLAILPNFFFEPVKSREECENMLREIYNKAMNTEYLRRNTWEPLYTAYSIVPPRDGRMNIESNKGKLYIEFSIEECL